MARVGKRLNARAVATITTPGLHADGDGLYLVVDARGSKRWSFIFQWEGKRREMGLGRLADVTLAEARDQLAEGRKMVRDGINPIVERRTRPSETAFVSFGAFADELVDSIAHGFRNEKHIDQWRMTLREYAAPIRHLTIDAVDTRSVLQCLEPIWLKKPETASRVRGRIERVLDAARAKGLRTGDNPARWKGHLDAILAPRQKLTRGHHRALPYEQLPALMKRLRDSGSVSALALEWTILSAARSGETLGARVGEVDLATATWTCPPHRMKAGREHRVPMTGRMVEIYQLLEPLRDDEGFAFPGPRRGHPLSGMAMSMQLRRMQVKATVHGFRSAFRDWVGEETEFAADVAEAALAHVVGDTTERAYRRGDALERRRRLMNAWSHFLGYGDGV